MSPRYRGGEDGGYDEFDDPELFSPITYERDSYAEPEPIPGLTGSPATRQSPIARRSHSGVPDAFEPTRPGSRGPTSPGRPGLPARRPPSLAGARPGRRRGGSVASALVLTGHSAASPAQRILRPLPTVALRVAPTAPPSPAGPRIAHHGAGEPGARAYTAANNQANAQRSDSVLATIETGSSYAVDAGLYRMQQAENAATYPAFGPQRAQYYIPRETPPTRAGSSSRCQRRAGHPKKITGTEYLLFTQTAPGAPWKNAVEPYLLAGAAPRRWRLARAASPPR